MGKANFYLGKVYDMEQRETTAEPLQYDADDLTTHGVVVGMTGSGKTGLCLDLMEEAALNEIPALMIDPKGDITNALLHFPDLLPSDFEPWIDPANAQRAGKSVGQVATETSMLWRNGLSGWDIGSDRIQQLKDSAHFSIYTPGSDAGIKISILSSLAAPAIPWAGNEESLRERIGSTVTAILGLIGKTNIDPVRDREHILLANIFEHAWSRGKDLTLGELIMQTQSPPFEKLGVFDIGMFFPDKDRFDLAIQLNNILASPSFQSWIEGEPLDIERMLYTPDGKPRHTIFYIAHLNDAERMFFVTLLYGAVETWMRTQSGTGALRALVYFDEIFGYLPPTANPPSKEPMLRLLKQARAFGVGMVLATQNPVDIDYKALSNAGTWFIGKLGTDQDKQRLLDGLESAMGQGHSRAVYDRMISNLGKRVFLLRNVHEKAPVLFQTRWAMNYLAGPITRSRIGELNTMAGAELLPVVSDPSSVTSSGALESNVGRREPMAKQAPAPKVDPMEAIGTMTRPKVPGRVAEFFLPSNLSVDDAAARERRDIERDDPVIGVVYRPILIAQADIRFSNRKYDLDESVVRSALVPDPDDRGMVRWEDYELTGAIDARELDRQPARDARFGDLDSPLNTATVLTSLKKDFQEWAYRNSEVMVRSNDKLKVYGNTSQTEDEFIAICRAEAEKAMKGEVDKLETRFEKKLLTLKTKLKKEERELQDDLADVAARKREEMVGGLETVAGFFGFGRKKSFGGSMTKRRMTAKAQADVEESEEEIERLEKEIRDLDTEMDTALAELNQKWQDIADDIDEIRVQPYKKDVLVDIFGVAWMPHHVVEQGGRVLELAAFGAD